MTHGDGVSGPFSEYSDYNPLTSSRQGHFDAVPVEFGEEAVY